MKSTSVSKKLIVSFTIIAAFSIVLACVGIISTSNIHNEYSFLIEFPIGRKNDLRGIQLDFLMMRYRAANYVMNSGNADFITNTATVQYKTAYAALTDKLNMYRQRNVDDSKRDPMAIKSNLDNAVMLENLLVRFDNSAQGVREHAMAGDLKAADDALKGAIPLTGDINALLDKMIKDADDFVAGTTVGIDKSADNNRLIQIGLAIFCIALSILLTVYISRFISKAISKPLTVLSALMKRIGSTGDITLRQEDIDNFSRLERVNNEIGQTAEGCYELLAHITNAAEKLRDISDGDLTVENDVLSDADTIGISLKNMVDNLNNMFGEINASVTEVSIGAKQLANTAASIASGATVMAGDAQSIAEGATEQAASIEKVSSSIATITEKTKASVDMTDQAAKLANTIIGKVEKGSRQMEEMIRTVNDITNASKSVSNIMETINSIASQTNLLALNAAIEAARAGEHGKGFAVVADEVRKLAAQSRTAVEETNSIIQNSLQHAELGVQVADEMAASLAEIIAGINESNRLIMEIAKASEEQSVNISKINVNIDQVADTVQQNSALSKKSAAAAEENAEAAEESAALANGMSSQSDILGKLIAQLKLKNKAQLMHLKKQA